MRTACSRAALTLLTMVVAAAAAWASLRADWLWRVDTAIYDTLLPTLSTAAPDDVLLVTIDDLSLSQLGRWPWPRRVHAAFIDVLTAEAVRTVIYNVAFTEPTSRDDDERLASAVRRNGRVVLPVVVEEGPTGALIEAIPIPPLAIAAAGLGHVEVEADPDGITRTLYLRAGIGRAHWPALPLAGQLVAIGRSAADTVAPGDDVSAEQAPPSLAWVRDERVLVPFSGPGHYARASYVDVLRRRFPAERLRGTTVVVGVTAVGLGSTVPTPTTGASGPMSGAELVASAYDALRGGRTLRYLDVEPTTLLTAGLAVLVPLAVSSSSALPVGLVLSLALPLLVAIALMHGAAIWFTPSPAIFGAALGCVAQRALRRSRPDRSAAAEAERIAEVGSVGEAVLRIDAEERVEYPEQDCRALERDDAGACPRTAGVGGAPDPRCRDASSALRQPGRSHPPRWVRRRPRPPAAPRLRQRGRKPRRVGHRPGSYRLAGHGPERHPLGAGRLRRPHRPARTHRGCGITSRRCSTTFAIRANKAPCSSSTWSVSAT